jgi:hypothetical protein
MLDAGKKFLASIVLSLLVFIVPLGMQPVDAAETEVRCESFVGVSGRLDQVVLPGPELKVKPVTDRREPFILRVEQVYPHGTDFRYDLVYYGLEPGEYNLCDYLVREDGSPADDLPPLTVKVATSLPPGHVEPNPLQPDRAPRMGGYRSLIWALAGLWVLGLATLIYFVQKRRVVAHRLVQAQVPLSRRLQHVVNLVLSGRFTESDKSQLEQLLMAYWRKQLHLEDASPEEAMAAMRANHEAAHLLEQLERWLYRPEGVERAEVVELLRPYQNVPEYFGETKQQQGSPC